MFSRFIYLYLLFVYEYLCFTSKNLFCRRLFGKQLVPRVELVKRITKHLENINIVYVKIFQSLFLEKNLFTDDEKEYLINYTDNVPYNNSDINYETLDILEKNHDIIVSNKKPINSGIVGLAFNGIDKKDNKNVIVKLLRKDINNKYKNVFDELEFISKILIYIPYINNLNLYKMISDSKDNILSQTDFIQEANNILLFKSKFSENNDYIIPYVYKEITKQLNNIIVMENIKGLKFSDIMQMDNNIKYEFSKLFIKFGYLSILNYSCIQGDLHAGNLFFYINKDKIPKYQMGIIDFGITYFPCKENQNIYYNFFYNIQVKKDFTYLRSIVYGLINNKDYYNSFSEKKKIKFLELVKNCIIEHSKGKLDMYFFIDLSRLFKIYGLEYTKEFNNISISLQICGSLAEQLNENQYELQTSVMKEFNEMHKLLEIE